MPRNQAARFAWRPEITLGGSDAISAADAARQTQTAQAIITRLQEQPGLVLADEVGLGKTFVALAVAASVALSTGRKSPVVVMVPPALKTKWPLEWVTFEQNCLPKGHGLVATDHTVEKPADFLRLFDDSRTDIAFVAHGALTRQVDDPFTRLAIIKAAFHRTQLSRQKSAFARWASSLLRNNFDEDTTLLLLETPISEWKDLWNSRKKGPQLDDDPVFLRLPSMIKDSGVSLAPLREVLRSLPLNQSPNIDRRLKRIKPELIAAIQDVWNGAIGHASIHSPLLILDEAHHVRHHTRVARLFTTPEGVGDAEALHSGGALAGKFDRMLFLTATPFQLGHQELISVLERFNGINWPNAAAATEFNGTLTSLASALDRYQESAKLFERAWGRLTPSDLGEVPDSWWDEKMGVLTTTNGRVSEARADVSRLVRDCAKTQKLLAPWIIRHVRDDRSTRRVVLPGEAIRDQGNPEVGLNIPSDALFPFLIAARARTIVAENNRRGSSARAHFAEGLASSFEAYRFTREGRLDVDGDDSPGQLEHDPDLAWYLDRIEKALPRDREPGTPVHPKVAATVDRTVRAWAAGEKVLIFCFYRETGKALRREVSAAIERRIFDDAARLLNIDPSDSVAISERLKRIAINSLDSDSRTRREIDALLLDMCRPMNFTPEESELFGDVVRGFLRTESFIVRYVLPHGQDGDALLAALRGDDGGSEPLRDRLERFLERLAKLPDQRRAQVLKSLDEYKTGRTMTTLLSAEGDTHKTMVLPNVRLANGGVKQETREVLVTAFNMPFFPEVLIASPVLSEGVDLHWECRTVIHHDLDWNPSSLEQRNGRVDRIGSRSEIIGSPIEIYQPYTTGLQDEKTYKVVTDRARWFNIVMGEQEDLSESGTDQIAERVAIPPGLVKALTHDLRVYRS
jgi:hypothetical protein